MGQQPNIQLHLEDLPRPEAHPGPARPWSARRPGDLVAPQQVPWGGAFGTPGPDTGYALRLLAGRPLALAEGERRDQAEGLVAALMAARASLLGRAPVAADAEVAEMILGLGAEGPAAGAAADARRRLWGQGAEAVRRLLEATDPELLAAPADEVRRRWAAGERLVG
ncbi:MAG: hypothetical protein H6Q11_710 [Acidobacteria bacterium]|nr:hypothetical protein [Acidobacteriota bacterium]